MKVRISSPLFMAFVLTCLLISSTAVGQFGPMGPMSCQDLFEPPLRLKAFGSAIEMEIGATAGVIELFDTLDGTLAPLANGYGAEVIPSDIRWALQDYVGIENDPLTAPWDILSIEEKKQVLMHSAFVRKHDFYEERKIPGLKYRERIQLKFLKDTRFLGRMYPPGVYQFETKEIFGSTGIEYMGPGRMIENLGFELHIRSFLPAGENQATARALQNNLAGMEHTLHEHIVAALPKAFVKKPTRSQRFWKWLERLYKVSSSDSQPTLDKRIEVFRMADFIRRTTLYFDFKMIENGIPMQTIKGINDSVNFFPIDPMEIYYFLKALFLHNQSDRKAYSKSGTVGVRTDHFYDQKDIWGIELRYLSPRLDATVTNRDLGTLQDKMISQTYFMSQAQAKSYLQNADITNENILSKMMQLLYVHDFYDRIPNDKTDRAKFDIAITAELQNNFVRMLFHDWSKDPMLVGQSERIAQIERAQTYCTALLFKGQPSTEVMKIFLKKSALAYLLQQMMEPQP